MSDIELTSFSKRAQMRFLPVSEPPVRQSDWCPVVGVVCAHAPAIAAAAEVPSAAAAAATLAEAVDATAEAHRMK